jgi:hypothetical protein
LKPPEITGRYLGVYMGYKTLADRDTASKGLNLVKSDKLRYTLPWEMGWREARLLMPIIEFSPLHPRQLEIECDEELNRTRETTKNNPLATRDLHVNIPGSQAGSITP